METPWYLQTTLIWTFLGVALIIGIVLLSFLIKTSKNAKLQFKELNNKFTRSQQLLEHFRFNSRHIQPPQVVAAFLG
jgi:uncharacterized membrane-anchored protein YhcB (DUF1043 family)